MQSLHLACEKPCGFHRRLVAVIEIAGDDQGIDLLLEAEIDNRDQCLPAGIADEFGKVRIAQGKRAERRVEMNIGGVDEAKGHGSAWIRRVRYCLDTGAVGESRVGDLPARSIRHPGLLPSRC